jgi:thiosulfate/3-mercaptopyruvate sulfurtransferase
MTGAGGLLVTASALAAELADEQPPVVLDVRWRLAGPPGLDSYREGHLPGAVFTDLDRDLSGPPGPGGRHPLPDAAAFQQAMRAAGVSQRSRVVVYDDGDATSAARCWWLLRYHGHRDVRVLDGAVGVYCGSGVTAAHEVLALALAGITAALYVGSWSHWITDPARPVATGGPDLNHGPDGRRW